VRVCVHVCVCVHQCGSLTHWTETGLQKGF